MSSSLTVKKKIIIAVDILHKLLTKIFLSFAPNNLWIFMDIWKIDC